MTHEHIFLSNFSSSSTPWGEPFGATEVDSTCTGCSSRLRLSRPSACITCCAFLAPFTSYKKTTNSAGSAPTSPQLNNSLVTFYIWLIIISGTRHVAHNNDIKWNICDLHCSLIIRDGHAYLIFSKFTVYQFQLFIYHFACDDIKMKTIVPSHAVMKLTQHTCIIENSKTNVVRIIHQWTAFMVLGKYIIYII